MARVRDWASERMRDIAVIIATPIFCLLFLFLRPKDGDQ